MQGCVPAHVFHRTHKGQSQVISYVITTLSNVAARNAESVRMCIQAVEQAGELPA